MKNTFKRFMKDMFLISRYARYYGTNKAIKEEKAIYMRLAYNPYILLFDNKVQQNSAKRYIQDNF